MCSRIECTLNDNDDERQQQQQLNFTNREEVKFQRCAQNYGFLNFLEDFFECPQRSCLMWTWTTVAFLKKHMIRILRIYCSNYLSFASER